MVVPGRDKLSGQVEVDETFIGGVRPGKRGRGAEGKVLVAGAIERAEQSTRGFGRARLSIIPDATTAALREFITTTVADEATVITNGLPSYPGALTEDGYEHEPLPVKGSGKRADELLPGVHRLFSLTKRWLEGTHHGRVEADHLQAYR